MELETFPLFWLILNLCMVAMQSFFSMMEMSCVSFNKVRLQYYVTEGNVRAGLIHYLLQRPFRLFGTTLIGVNVAMFFGSEFARQFHTSIGLSPDLAPLTQVLIVVIFGELAPMFAARRYAEHLALLGIPLLYATAKIMTPFTWGITMVTTGIQNFFGYKEKANNIFLDKEELQNLIEESTEGTGGRGQNEFNWIVSHIFRLKSQTAEQVMTPFSKITVIPPNCTVGQMKNLLIKKKNPFLLMHGKTPSNIIGIANARDLLREPDHKKVRNFIRKPWFIPKSTDLMAILNQFRTNHQRIAVVLDDKAGSIGIIFLDQLLSDIFTPPFQKEAPESKTFFIEKTFSGDTRIEDLNKTYQLELDPQGCETLEELFNQIAGPHAEEGEKCVISPYELEVKEATLLEIKRITIRTLR